MSAALAVEDAPSPGKGDALAPGFVGAEYDATFAASGGSGTNYRWKFTGSPAPPAWLRLDEETGILSGTPGSDAEGKTSVTVQVTDDSGTTEQRSFSLIINPAKHSPLYRHLTFWLAIFALAVPILGGIGIMIYAFSTPGQHWNYLAVGSLTAAAAFLAGSLAGFVVGIPRAVSSGQARHDPSSEYLPSSNLAEISDWLTKLLLGAGLVSLARLGAPIASLIDHVAAGLHTTAASTAAAQVMAAAIMFGYAALGLLEGSVVTALWYQKKLAKLNN
jgi:hypothetical protein